MLHTVQLNLYSGNYSETHYIPRFLVLLGSTLESMLPSQYCLINKSSYNHRLEAFVMSLPAIYYRSADDSVSNADSWVWVPFKL